MNFIYQLYLSIILIACPLIISGQALSDTIPLPKNCIEGRLPNGLKYSIQRNTLPAKKVEFRLVINVGSILENDQQRGMSHFLEHMAFNESLKFPENSVVTILKNMGIKYGYDLNAFTDYDKTIYVLPIPTDDEANVNKAIDILKSWMTSLTLNKKNIEKEKKIVIQEIKDFKQDDPFYEIKLNNSHYNNRFTLGTEQDVLSIDSIGLRNYYDTWYRPDLSTIIVVGDICPLQIEEKIKNKFTPIEARTDYSAKRITYSIPTIGKSVFNQIKDTFLINNKLEIIFPKQDKPIITYNDLRNKLVEELFNTILDNQINSYYLGNIYYSQSWYLSDISHKVFHITATTDSLIINKVRKLASILSQLKQYGIKHEELDDVKNQYINKILVSDFSRTSQSLCYDYIDMAVVGDRPILNSLKYNFYKKIINTITVKEIESYLQIFFEQLQKKLICYKYNPLLNKNKGLELSSIIYAWNLGLNSKAPSYSYNNINKKEANYVKKSLIIDSLKTASIITEKEYKSLGLLELYLTNGLRVALRPTYLSDNDDIVVLLLSKGGYSILPKGKYPYYEGMAAYIDMGGVGNLDNNELNDFCYEKNITVSTALQEDLEPLEEDYFNMADYIICVSYNMTRTY